jgi:uncharacterized membrane protein YgdD (TMEM256/DUF423 family)
VSLEPKNENGSASPDSKIGGALLCVLACAGLAGAAGVALAAVAAHKVDSPALATAAMMLMLHAVAAIALLAMARSLRLTQWWLRLAALMLAAVTLFSGDIALHTLTGSHIFPMAAPTGGSLLIASWLGVALLAALEWRGFLFGAGDSPRGEPAASAEVRIRE